MDKYDFTDIGPFRREGRVLLAVDKNRGGYFLTPDNDVENIVFKGNGAANCIMGSLSFFKRLVHSKGNGNRFDFTKEGKRILEVA